MSIRVNASLAGIAVVRVRDEIKVASGAPTLKVMLEGRIIGNAHLSG